ncbi:unnamed protein product [Caenorhabditis angaria]|uniref:Mediator of RNA polymerase II transcription subunit 29 n=1 Tax=Caenorhabditis angaria TaxID=860376 RepID=A0A9P1MXT7_9PELO|nr:unnamed protein product [Caenorhabditis angaria]
MSGGHPGGYNPHNNQQIYQQQQMMRQQQQNYQMLQNPQLMQAQNQSSAHNSPRSATPNQLQQLQQHSRVGSPAQPNFNNLNQQPHGSPSNLAFSNSNLAQVQDVHSKPATPQMMHSALSAGHLTNMNPMSVPLAAISRPASVAPPQSLPANILINNPGSIQQPGSIQRPGSVIPPGSIHGPGSVQAHGPGSIQAPGSVHGPGSIQAHGPGSVQAHGPSSVHGPGSIQPPGSLHAPGSQHNLNLSSHGPSSVAPPGSVAGPGSVMGGPASVQPAAPAPTTSQTPAKPTEEQLRQVMDPVVLLRTLIATDLRASIVEVNQEHEDGLLEQYKRAYNDFLAICDDIDRILTTILESNKQVGKLEKVLGDGGKKGAGKPATGQAGTDHSAGLMNCVNQFIESTAEVQRMFDSTIGSVTGSMEKIRRRQKKFEEGQRP